MVENINNVKVVHTKETMTASFSQKPSPKSNSTERCSKSTQQTRRKTRTIKAERNFIKITLLHGCRSVCKDSNIYLPETLRQT